MTTTITILSCLFGPVAARNRDVLDHVLDHVPGEKWAEESGLTDKQYIVPGGGGLGELMNNAYV